MASSIGDFAEAKLLDHVLGTASYTFDSTIFCSLHTATPADTGASEVTGGSYARLAFVFGAATNPGGVATQSGALNFTLMPACTVTAIGIWDTVTAGNFLWGGDLTASKVVNSGDTFQLPNASVTVTLA